MCCRAQLCAERQCEHDRAWTHTYTLAHTLDVRRAALTPLHTSEATLKAHAALGDNRISSRPSVPRMSRARMPLATAQVALASVDQGLLPDWSGTGPDNTHLSNAPRYKKLLTQAHCPKRLSGTDHCSGAAERNRSL
jgi:hypothetical protein